MQNQANKQEERVYHYQASCVFRKTKEQYGGLSNMASGFPINLNGISIYSSEALYQACRFPHMPEIQELILKEKSAMTAKMISKPYREDSRKDWMELRVKIMRWCLKVKLAQNFDSFGRLIESTTGKDIVEESGKDPFWGALTINENQLKGINALGRLIMEIRNLYNSEDRYHLLVVPPLAIPNFKLMGKKITKIDERKNHIKFLKVKMRLEKEKKIVLVTGVSKSNKGNQKKKEMTEELLLF